MILLLDHEDSFVHILADMLRVLGGETLVRRVTDLDLAAVVALSPSHLVLSPGPFSPRECPLTLAVIRALGPRIPTLGVCLGHQCIAEAYGATVIPTAPRHGLTSPIGHTGEGVFQGLPSPFAATRYHSLAVEPASLPAALTVTATALDDGTIMGIRHREHPVAGVQFHPESILTEHGSLLLERLLAMR